MKVTYLFSIVFGLLFVGASNGVLAEPPPADESPPPEPSEKTFDLKAAAEKKVVKEFHQYTYDLFSDKSMSEIAINQLNSYVPASRLVTEELTPKLVLDVGLTLGAPAVKAGWSTFRRARKIAKSIFAEREYEYDPMVFDQKLI